MGVCPGGSGATKHLVGYTYINYHIAFVLYYLGIEMGIPWGLESPSFGVAMAIFLGNHSCKSAIYFYE